MRLWGLRKCFKFGVIRCPTEGVIGRKPQSPNFHQNFRGPWRKNYGSDPKKFRGTKMRRRSSMRMQSSMEIGGRTATGDENNVVFCLLDCIAVWHVSAYTVVRAISLVNGKWRFSATWGSRTPEPIELKIGHPTPQAKTGLRRFTGVRWA